MDIFTYVSAQALRYFLTRSPTLRAAGLGGVLVKSCVFVSGTWWINDCCASSNAGSSWAEHAHINYVYRSIIIPAHRHEEKAF